MQLSYSYVVTFLQVFILSRCYEDLQQPTRVLCDSFHPTAIQIGPIFNLTHEVRVPRLATQHHWERCSRLIQNFHTFGRQLKEHC